MADDIKEYTPTDEQKQEAQVFDDLTSLYRAVPGDQAGDAVGTGDMAVEDVDDESDLANLQPANLLTQAVVLPEAGNAPPDQELNPAIDPLTEGIGVPPVTNPRGAAEDPVPPTEINPPTFDPIVFPRPSVEPESFEEVEAQTYPDLQGSAVAEAVIEPLDGTDPGTPTTPTTPTLPSTPTTPTYPFSPTTPTTVTSPTTPTTVTSPTTPTTVT
ncbi:MAG: hypothetical protein HQM00_14270, partial [Magnetococcales bacterium]|nr:hypothetical protein [Magnetococcales bacterium]